MTKSNQSHSSFIALVLIGIAFAVVVAIPPTAEAGGDAVVVIVNASNPVDNLSVAELKKIFLSDRSKWDTGKSVAPVMTTAGSAERTAFLKIVCGMSDADFGKYFMQAAFTGKLATPPKEVGSARDVKGVVAASPGAIGFVPSGEFHEDSGIRAVKVDGMDAASAGYKLHM